jgi:hypothetical protein
MLSCRIRGSDLSRWYLARFIRLWRWRPYLPLRCRLTSNGLHGVICHLLPCSKELDPILRDLNVSQVLPHCFSTRKINFVIILLSLSDFSKWLLSFALSSQYISYMYYFQHACSTSSPFHCHGFYIECSLCRLIRRPLIGRHWYLPANWRWFIQWSPEQWVSPCYAIECGRSFYCALFRVFITRVSQCPIRYEYDNMSHSLMVKPVPAQRIWGKFSCFSCFCHFSATLSSFVN